MEFTFINTNSKHTYITFHDFILKQSLKRLYLHLLVQISVGVGLIVIDLLTWNETWEIHNGYKLIEVNLHLFLGMGAAYLLKSLSFLIRLTIEKNKFLLSYQKDAISLFEHSKESTLIVDEFGIRFVHDALKQELSWKIISGYLESRDFIVFFNGEALSSTMVIDKKNYTIESISELRSFIGSKVPEKKRIKPVLH